MITKKLFPIFLLLLSAIMFGQDTNVVWIKNIDTLNFKMHYDKKLIPKDFYKYIQIETLKDIANPNENYRSGCIGAEGVPGRRLNWIAKDNKNHLVLSVSVGGKAHRTCYYYLDYEKKKLNVNELFLGHQSMNLTFCVTAIKIKNKQFEFLAHDE